jgi:ribosomal protein L4
MVEKTLVERLNNREYVNALKSAIAMAVKSNAGKPTVFDGIAKISKTKDFVKFLETNKLYSVIEFARVKTIRSVRKTRSKQQHKMLVVTSDEEGSFRASRNVKGVTTCTLSELQVSSVAPGGNPVKTVLWSASALKNLDAAVEKAVLIKKGAKNVSA